MIHARLPGRGMRLDQIVEVIAAAFEGRLGAQGARGEFSKRLRAGEPSEA